MKSSNKNKKSGQAQNIQLDEITVEVRPGVQEMLASPARYAAHAL